MAASHRRLDLEDVGDVTVAKFIDKKILDESNIQLIGNQMFSLVEDDGKRKVLLDFSNVEYLSSAALGKLIVMDKKLKAAQGQLSMCAVRAEILEVFTEEVDNGDAIAGDRLLDQRPQLDALLCCRHSESPSPTPPATNRPTRQGEFESAVGGDVARIDRRASRRHSRPRRISLPGTALSHVSASATVQTPSGASPCNRFPVASPPLSRLPV
ncbi:MAG TPA: STAS domain-containing protein [Planctomycetes bacterium]|nr:STAS domain-containing protein [Planctomycetota bacterium]